MTAAVAAAARVAVVAIESARVQSARDMQYRIARCGAAAGADDDDAMMTALAMSSLSRCRCIECVGCDCCSGNDVAVSWPRSSTVMTTTTI